MAQSAEELRQDIEQTRHDLSRDVDAINENVSPGKIVQRRLDRTRNAAGAMMERVMGKASATTSGIADTAGQAQPGIAGTLSAAPGAALRRTEGNPLAAGLVTFAAGWLVSSMLPASRVEEQAAEKLQEQAEQLKEPLKEQAMELKEGLQGTAQDAASTLKETAASAAQTVTDQGRSSAQSLQDDAKGAAQEVRSSSNGSTSTSAL